ncbi:MAG TPA: reverse transcriptase-like protein [Candidatus Acidoferrum sp.]|nr:reverse transcriptase-like protein [Candidatus Acidoferrum sp.]
MMAQHPGSSRLFPDTPAGPPGGVYIANIDGASRGNPGPASYALILKDPSGKVVFQLGKKLGRQTNNVAEYYGLLAALDYAAEHGIKALRIRSDSELLVRQIKGQYKVKSADLKPLHERALKLVRQLEYFVIEHVLREMNREADALANQALDGGDTRYEGSRQPNSSEPGGHGSPSEHASRSKEGSGPRSGRSHDASVDGTIRARVVNGTLVPTQPLDLPEGSEVSISIRKSVK